MTKKEAIIWLKNWIPKVESLTTYQNLDYSREESFEELLESTYELEIKLGYVIKWFAVRVD